MDISNANTEPFLGYHLFHENINVNIKILSASLHSTIKTIDQSKDPDKLGKLITEADASWNNPPIKSFGEITTEQILSSVSNFGIIASYSAFDDFLNGIEAEIARYKSFSDEETNIDITKSANEKTKDEDEKIINIYERNNWDTKNIKNYLPTLKYFRLIRNCMAHRDSKSSEKLAICSKSEELMSSFNKHIKNKTINVLPSFSINDEIIIDPKLSIFYSHLLREVASDINSKTVSILGVNGLLNMAFYHLFKEHKSVSTNAYRRPQTVWNTILHGRYRMRLKDDTEAIQKAKNIKILVKNGNEETDLWKECIKQFEKKY
ncbi:hypothetical protein OO007_20090 [Cocleimonas sp. KMM 6892]|uniref:hypothetical protein n=1 Tax=unclassified Cocleimonas TaxID=2639732 RepID=UPI002DBA3DA8|nr:MULTISPECIES: hypothetical protein [unclassified Cocleimonas]MEB8434550.1 hypothetical protein [Cocleimonas sp. KMM 6892]MEC4717443.1 hypothetical protein [Cocleimonas sp. KMM 6895]MEC4746763.1 hypothetical protein [Cocleimonas sp. KMM 6896]